MLKRNNVPLLIGSVVHFHSKPAYIRSMDSHSGFVYIVTMDERKDNLRVFPKDIGAKWFL